MVARPWICAAALLVIGASNAAASDGPTSFTTTNVQEAGVDEPDLLKTNGQHAFYFSGTRMTVIDISDRARPERVASLPVGGRQASMFLVDDRLVTLSRSGASVDLGVIDVRDPGFPQSVWRTRLDGRLLGARAVEGLVYLALAKVRGDEARLEVASLDPSRPGRPSSVSIPTRSVLVARSQVYASLSSLYVAEPAEVETNIHLFDLNDGSPIYHASGVLDGRLRSPFWMSEHAGLLRVATTGRRANALSVLEPRRSELRVVDQVRGFGPGKQITASRFHRDRGYLTTWAPGNDDPLHAFDTHDDGAVALQGELHINGVSTYLDVDGPDYLTGYGLVNAEAPHDHPSRLQLQLFDVSNPARPALAHAAELDFARSEALCDHHAITRGVSGDLLAIPVASPRTHGLLLLHVTPESGFRELGLVRHRAPVRRSAFVDDYLLAFSDLGMTVSHVGDPSRVLAEVRFAPTGAASAGGSSDKLVPLLTGRHMMRTPQICRARRR